MNAGIRICLWTAVVNALCLASNAQSDDGFTDENRPYKFGFNIEGYQHRYEEKDEKGIIMGEFGFITADGVYHLTVYATDENGDFKILKMKNIKIGLPMDKTTTPVPPVPSANKVPPRAKEDKSKQTHLTGVMGCSGCHIPTTRAPEREVPGPNPPLGIGPLGTKTPTGTSTFTGTKPPTGTNTFTGTKPPTGTNTFTGTKPQTGTNTFTGTKPPTGTKTPTGTNTFTGTNPPTGTNTFTGTKPAFGEKLPTSQVKPQGNNPPAKMGIDDLMGLLYKFNYTLAFHGHHETGDRAGNKEGGYFFNGRDGFARDVKYVANEFGYQPNITLVELDPESTPKEETEKLLDKLKGYEFKWFYVR